MIAELGHFALILAFVLAVAQATLPFWGAMRNDPRMIAVAGPAAVTQFLLVGLAFAALVHAYIVSDFSLLNVVENSHSQKPLLFKITGTWGNHEGSMLLWVLILALFGALVAAFGRNLPDRLKALPSRFQEKPVKIQLRPHSSSSQKAAKARTRLFPAGQNRARRATRAVKRPKPRAIASRAKGTIQPKAAASTSRA